MGPSWLLATRLTRPTSLTGSSWRVDEDELERLILAHSPTLVIDLESLVLMKLVSNRRKNQVHVQDMIGVRLIDPSWLTKLPPELAVRLKHIMDTPDA
jgi:hypothetical protein